MHKVALLLRLLNPYNIPEICSQILAMLERWACMSLQKSPPTGETLFFWEADALHSMKAQQNELL